MFAKALPARKKKIMVSAVQKPAPPDSLKSADRYMVGPLLDDAVSDQSKVELRAPEDIHMDPRHMQKVTMFSLVGAFHPALAHARFSPVCYWRMPMLIPSPSSD